MQKVDEASSRTGHTKQSIMHEALRLWFEVEYPVELEHIRARERRRLELKKDSMSSSADGKRCVG